MSCLPISLYPPSWHTMSLNVVAWACLFTPTTVLSSLAQYLFQCSITLACLYNNDLSLSLSLSLSPQFVFHFDSSFFSPCLHPSSQHVSLPTTPIKMKQTFYPLLSLSLSLSNFYSCFMTSYFVRLSTFLSTFLIFPL